MDKLLMWLLDRQTSNLLGTALFSIAMVIAGIVVFVYQIKISDMYKEEKHWMKMSETATRFSVVSSGIIVLGMGLFMAWMTVRAIING